MATARWKAGCAALTLISLSTAAFAREAMEFTSTQRGHWAWKRPTRPTLPVVKNTAWAANPIDRFVLARLEASKLQPAPTASREVLIRRVAFDLTGLPPTPAETDAFLADKAPNAYEKVVDHYLASPHYGERMAQQWLDLARYADSNGYEYDELRPNAWRYRDYVVRSFNADKPYQRFVMEQVAGDEIAPMDPDARIATGFNLLGPDMTDAADQAARRQNTLNDMTDTTGLAFLGMTVGCARCHNHKYEPIPQEDYYRLQAFFAPSTFRKDLPVGTPEELARFAGALREHEARLKSIQDRIDTLVAPVREPMRAARLAKLPEDVQTAFRTPDPVRTVEQQMIVRRNLALVDPNERELTAALPPADRAQFEALLNGLRAETKNRPAEPATAMALSDEATQPVHTFILERGELSNRGPEVTPGVPIILAKTGPRLEDPATGRRAALAKWIASSENPLTARVIVNRVWQWDVGRGILPTTSDFGVRGEDATHPELLDYLATVFTAAVQGPKSKVQSGASAKADLGPGTWDLGLGWSIKKLHRLILLSTTYKQSSQPSAAALAADPDNRLFSRMPRRRLDAEAIRDTVLFASGQLNEKMGGPPVFPPIPEALRPSPQAWPTSSDPADHVRRSLYTAVRRTLRYPALEAFDAPDTNQSCPRREVSTTAPQALQLLNAPEMVENARGLAGRVLKEAADEPSRIRLAYRLTIGRQPRDEELALGQAFLAKQAALLKERPVRTLATPKPLPVGTDPAAGAALTDYCLALLNLNEFVYLD